MKKLAIFDFDGTLVDTAEDVVICFNEVLTAYDFATLNRDEYIDLLRRNIDEAVSLMLGKNNTPENINLVIEAYEKSYADSKKENSHPFDNVHEILKALQDKGILLAINSNRKNDSIMYFTDRFFSDIDFADIKGHDSAYLSKPRPCGVKKIIKKLGVSRDEILYIGDSSTDIETARNAEVDCLIVKWGYGNQEDWDNDYIAASIDSPCEILKYF